VSRFTKAYDGSLPLSITPRTTLFSAIVALIASVRLAHDCGLIFGNKKLQRLAGRAADAPAQEAAHELGLLPTDEVVIGAAESASVPELQWLHTEQRCPLPPGICDHAARSGSSDALKWLKAHGSVLGPSTCKAAAAGAHLHVLQYLCDVGCVWKESACTAAASYNHLEALQWLREQGCPWFMREAARVHLCSRMHERRRSERPHACLSVLAQ
jgi:hypothetical protein